jgi:hypothetical protein
MKVEVSSKKASSTSGGVKPAKMENTHMCLLKLRSVGGGDGVYPKPWAGASSPVTDP